MVYVHQDFLIETVVARRGRNGGILLFYFHGNVGGGGRIIDQSNISPVTY